ncbi:MAG: lysylphosphatidylglycerol synthase domain-containing protein [Gemmatimonadales bacterium]
MPCVVRSGNWHDRCLWGGMEEQVPPPEKEKRWIPGAWIAVRVALACLAFIALRRELVRVSASDIRHAIATFGPGSVVAALICAGASFLTLAIFEVLALRDAAAYEGGESARTVPARVAIVTSFVSNALSQSIGFAVLTGSAIRMRVYSRYSLSAAAIARISTFVTITATLGLLAAGAVAMFETPAAIPTRFGVSLRVFGVALSIPAIAYLLWAMVGRGTIGGATWFIRPPSRRLALAQVTLSVIDWLLTGTVLFVLLPSSTTVGYAAFLGVYLVAQTAGVVSHVPGGFGVFEGAFISLLSVSDPGMNASVVAASLVVYRIVYYLLPLIIAMVIAGVVDVLARKPVIVLQPWVMPVFVHGTVDAR